MMFWTRISLQKLYRRYHSNKISRTGLAAIDRKGLKLKPLRQGFGDETIPGKQKIGSKNFELNEHRVRKRRRMRGDNEGGDKNVVFDRISELPEPIIHHIYSFLSCSKDVVRTCILSKKWNSTFKSYLTFDFDERYFRVPGGKGKGKHNRIKTREVQRKKFKNFVEKSMASRINPVPCIDKFRMHVITRNEMLEGRMARWIRAAMEKNVKQLEIHMHPGEKEYKFPDVLRSKSLTSLKASGSEFSNFGRGLKLGNLRELSIKDATQITETLIKKFEEGCPLIEDLRLVRCKGLSHLAISVLVKLRRVEVHECGAINYIVIKAPNLETFWYHAKIHQHCKLDLKGCEILKHLILKDFHMTDTEFQDYISKWPLIEKLTLQECNSMERLTILSGKLKSLALIYCKKLKELDMDAPNLHSFEYSGHIMPFSSLNVFSLRKAKFSLLHSMKVPQVIVDYQKLFGYFVPFKDLKLITYSKQIMTVYEEPKQSDLGRVHFCKVDLVASSTNVLKTADNWLMEFHAKSISLVSPSRELSKEGDKDQTSEKKTIFVGPWGGNGGTNWDDGSYNGVREITIIYGSCIDSISVVYDKNGKPVSAEKHGGVGGSRTAAIKLQFPEEFFISVSGHYCPMARGGSHVIRSLTFKSNRRTFGPYGVEAGTPFSLPMEGGQIVGIKGRSGSYLDAIGFHITRTKTTKAIQKVQKTYQYNIFIS